jgi:hypothetical protein
VTVTPEDGEQPDSDGGFPTWGLAVAMIVIVLAGLGAILWHRIVVLTKDPERASDMRMTRPVLAIVLVGGLTLLATAAMRGASEQVQLLLLGGMVSLSSAVVSYYFSSSGAADARKDLLAATMGTAQVPDVTNMRVSQARKKMSGQSLALVVDPASAPDNHIVTEQKPQVGQVVAGSTIVTVTAKPMATGAASGIFTPEGSAPPPTLADLTAADAPVQPEPANAWARGQHITLGDKTQAHWDGNRWSAGPAP